MVPQKNAGGISHTSMLEHTLPSIATGLATYWACVMGTIVALDLSGIPILALVIGVGLIATWGTNTRGLWKELRTQNPAPLSPATIVLVLGVCIAISTIVISRVDFTAMSTRFDPHFETFEPAHIAQGSLLGFAAMLLYPHAKLKMLPERLTLLAVICGFLVYLVGARFGLPIWTAIAVAIVTRAVLHFLCFRDRGLMRASFPKATERLC